MTLEQPLTERFTRALTLACDLHRTQARKGTQIPYVAHLLGVASIALEHGAAEDEAIAAVLHDAVEDQGGAPTLARIRSEFGEAVAEIVDGCTDTDVEPKPPWRARKEAYIAKIATKSASTRLVSAAITIGSPTRLGSVDSVTTPVISNLISPWCSAVALAEVTAKCMLQS